jgi:DNA-binding Lrp family transcriptional regulator
MDRDTLIHLVQLKILKRYKLLVDCSELDETVLVRISKRLPKADEKEAPTFASWCDQVFGKGIRVPVARFQGGIAGKTHLSSLTDELGLTETLRQQEKVHKAAVKALEHDIAQIKSEHAMAFANIRTPPKERGRFSWDLRYWYSEVSRELRQLLPGIKEVEGYIFEYEGASNRDYRTHLVDIILSSVRQLESLGFDVVVELEDVKHNSESARNMVFHRTRTVDLEGGARKLFGFTVQKMPIDIIKPMHSTLSDPGIPALSLPCRVSVGGRHIEHECEDEISHLSYMVHKLFLALAKSADHVPRGVLREKILVCLMLCWTAPCMPANELGRPMTPRGRHYGGYDEDEDEANLEKTDIPVGKVVQHLFELMHENVDR